MRISDWSSDVCSSDLGFEIVAACQQLGRDIDLARTDFEQELQQVGDQRAFLAEPGFTLVERNGKVSAIDLKIEGEPMPIEEFAPRRDDRGERPGGARGRRQLTGERTSGTVKFFNTTKGFGFIARDDGQADAFVHVTAVQRAGLAGLEEGDRLSFDIEVDDRGKFAAVNLQPASE